MKHNYDFSTLTIAAVQEALKEMAPTAELVEALRADGRQGLQKMAQQVLRQLEMQTALARRYEEMLTFEKRCWEQGIQYVTGVDEAGRGPLAGPVVAAAIILPGDFYLPGLNDSKQLSAAEREEYYAEIKNSALALGVGVVGHREIDEINILQASFKAMTLAVTQIREAGFEPGIVLVDGDKAIPALDILQETIVDGDERSISIAAASVIAKVTRDRMMVELAKSYPGYGFERNKGYSAPEHLEGLRKLGPSPVHRMTFSLVRQATYSADFHQLADELFRAETLAGLLEAGLVLGRLQGELPENEFAELLQIYSKLEKKLKAAAKTETGPRQQAMKML